VNAASTTRATKRFTFPVADMAKKAKRDFAAQRIDEDSY
jgi:hypothetical protein